MVCSGSSSHHCVPGDLRYSHPLRDRGAFHRGHLFVVVCWLCLLGGRHPQLLFTGSRSFQVPQRVTARAAVAQGDLTLALRQIQALEARDSSGKALNKLGRELANSGNVEGAIAVLNRLVERGATPQRNAYNTVLRACDSAGDTVNAETWFYKMQDADIVPDLMSWVSVINAYAAIGDVSAVVSWIEKMSSESEILPSVGVHNDILRAFADRGHVGIAVDWFQGMTESWGVIPNVNSYEAMIKAYAIAGQPDEAVAWFKALSAAHHRPTQECYSSVMLAYSKVGDREAVARWMNLMHAGAGEAAQNLYGRRESLAYDTSIMASAQSGDTGAAMKWISRMREAGLTPKKQSYTALIRAFARNSQPQLAEQCFSQMKEAGVEPDFRTYKEMLRAFNFAVDKEAIEHWFSSMVKAGFPADAESYALVIRTCAEEGNATSAQEWAERMVSDGFENNLPYSKVIKTFSKVRQVGAAIGWAEHAVSRNARLTVAAHNAVIKGLLLTEQDERARQWFAQMEENGVIPELSTWTMFIKRCNNENHPELAVQWLTQMEARGVPASAAILLDTLAAFVKSGKSEQMFQWLEESRENGLLQMDKKTYKTVIQAYVAKNDTASAEEWFQQMVAAEIPPDVETTTTMTESSLRTEGLKGARRWLRWLSAGSSSKPYDVILKAYIQLGTLKDAENLFYRMYEKSITPRRKSYLHMLRCCAARGQTADAEKWLKAMQVAGFDLGAEAAAAMAQCYALAGNAGVTDRWLQRMFDEGVPVKDKTQREMQLQAVAHATTTCFAESGQDSALEHWTSRFNSLGIRGAHQRPRAARRGRAKAVDGDELKQSALKQLLAKEAQGLVPSTSDFNDVLQVFAEGRADPEGTAALVDRMVNMEVARDSSTYQHVMSCFQTSGDAVGAVDWFVRMVSDGIEPAYENFQRVVSSVLSAYREGEVDPGKAFQQMVATADDNNLGKIHRRYDMLIQCLIRAGEMNLAAEWFKRATSQGILPKKRTCELGAEKALETGDEAKVLAWFSHAFDHNVATRERQRIAAFADGLIFNKYGVNERLLGKIVDFFVRQSNVNGRPRDLPFEQFAIAYARAGRLKEAAEWADNMTEAMWNPAPEVYLSIMEGYARAGGVDGAHKWFERMKLAGMPAKSRAYNAVLRAYAEAGDINGAGKWLKAMEEQDSRARHIMLVCYIKAGDVDGIKRWLDLMNKRGEPLDPKDIRHLIASFVDKRETWHALAVAKFLLKDVERNQQGKMWSMLIRGAGRDCELAEAIWREMHRHGAAPDSAAAENLQSILGEARFDALALELTDSALALA